MWLLLCAAACLRDAVNASVAGTHMWCANMCALACLLFYLTRHTCRGLILVAKTLQNLVNEVQFGEKENYMTGMNVFLVSHQKKTAEYYKKLLTDKYVIPSVEMYMRRVPEWVSDCSLHMNVETITQHTQHTTYARIHTLRHTYT